MTSHPKYPTSGRYPARVLADEQNLDFGPCRWCGSNDCNGHAEAPGFEPCENCSACLDNRRFDCREGQVRR